MGTILEKESCLKAGGKYKNNDLSAGKLVLNYYSLIKAQNIIRGRRLKRMDVGIRQSFQDAARAIKNARTLVITAGAGMGVDSGLPDYRGEKGFWKCYPMYEPLGLNYYDAANPMHFEEDPAFGWGFYAHRIDLYRKTTPHQGFQLLLKWISRFEMDHFVITSNVDGQFQKAGFSSEKVYEVHGSIHYLQCGDPAAVLSGKIKRIFR